MNPATEIEINAEVNRCAIQKVREEAGSCAHFDRVTFQLQAVIVYTYQVTAKKAISERQPARAAVVWKDYMGLRDEALLALNESKSRFPQCGTEGLYDLVLEYRDEAPSRCHENTQDSEWLKTAQSNPIFQRMIGTL